VDIEVEDPGARSSPAAGRRKISSRGPSSEEDQATKKRKEIGEKRLRLTGR
jgi:hypothetical protein